MHSGLHHRPKNRKGAAGLWRAENGSGRAKKKTWALAAAVLALCGAAAWAVLAPRAAHVSNSEASSAQANSAQADSVQTAPSEPAPAQQAPNDGIDELQQLLAGMTLEEKVGQMFLARCPRRDAARKAAEYHLGGYLLFSEDFEGRTPQTAAAEIASYQAAATVPLFIGVDEEGGAINRISRFSAFRAAPFPSPQQLYQADGLAAVRRDTLEKCAFLRGLGINMNFAPVCDVSTEESDFIYARTLGQGPQQTAAYAREVVQAMAGQGVASVLKHFPGYGNNADTHTGIAHDMRSYETFEQADFVPFRAGIEAGANVVLVCHNIVECMDASMPASLSPRVHEILRQELGFSGVIVTDDLYMRGIRDFMGPADAAVQAVLAGNDLLCCTEFEVQVPAVVEAVRHGVIDQAQVDASVLRILCLKQALGLL